MTTWSPGANPVTPGPVSSTIPAPSWPSTIGRGPGRSCTVRSVWHTPHATTRTSSSPAWGGPSSIASIRGRARPRATRPPGSASAHGAGSSPPSFPRRPDVGILTARPCRDHPAGTALRSSGEPTKETTRWCTAWRRSGCRSTTWSVRWGSTPTRWVCSVSRQEDNWSELEANGLRLGLNASEGETPGGEGGAVVSFQPEGSLDEAVEELRAQGVEFAGRHLRGESDEDRESAGDVRGPRRQHGAGGSPRTGWRTDESKEVGRPSRRRWWSHGRTGPRPLK